MRTALKGYKRRDSTTHRRYNRSASLRVYKRTGKFRNVGSGSGHRAGEQWGDKKDIDPESRVTKYSKNSPSFDEGVYLSKKKRAIAKKMIS